MGRGLKPLMRYHFISQFLPVNGSYLPLTATGGYAVRSVVADIRARHSIFTGWRAATQAVRMLTSAAMLVEFLNGTRKQIEELGFFAGREYLKGHMV